MEHANRYNSLLAIKKMSSPSLINIGELSKPATVLIEKVSAAIGVLYEPKKNTQRSSS